MHAHQNTLIEKIFRENNFSFTYLENNYFTKFLSKKSGSNFPLKNYPLATQILREIKLPSRKIRMYLPNILIGECRMGMMKPFLSKKDCCNHLPNGLEIIVDLPLYFHVLH